MSKEKGLQARCSQPYLQAGWDFVNETENGEEDTWWIDEEKDYPRLWWERIEDDNPASP